MADLATDKPSGKTGLHNWCMGLVDDAKGRRKHWEAQWWENIATYSGDFWVQYDVYKNRLFEPIPKADHKVRIPVNLAQPVLRTEYAKLVKNRPITDVLAASNDLTDLNSAEVGDKILNNHVEKKFSMSKVRRRAIQWALLTGMGGIFVDYDEAAETEIEVYQDPKGQPIFDQRTIEAYQAEYKRGGDSPKKMTIKRGDLRPVAMSPFGVAWDFSKNYIEDASWILVMEVFDVNDVYRRWNKTVEGDQNALPDVLEHRMLQQYDLTKKFELSQPSAQELVIIYRLFVRPGHKFFPDGAHVVFTEEEIIKQEGWPYPFNESPVSMMGHVPFPIAQHSLSVMQAIRPIVTEISKTESQIIENRNLMANPPWVIAKQHQVEKEIVNKPGLRLEYTHLPNIPPPAPAQMPEMPNYVTQLVEVLKEHVLEISGQGETSQGRVPPGARSGVAIAYLQEEDDTKLGPTVLEYEEMIERASFQILRVIAAKYDVPRTVRIFKKHGEPEVFDFMGNMLAGVAGVLCQSGSALPRSKAAKQQYILDLWDRKLETDPRRVREMLELSQGEPDEFEVDLDQAQRENRQLMAGQDPGVLDWYNHAAHHFIHRRFMKSADFQALDPEAQKVFTDHDDEHSAAEARQMQEQQAMAPQQGQPPQNGAPPMQPGSNGQNVPEGPPPRFASPNFSSMVNDQPQ